MGVSTNSSQQWDFASGQDAIHKMGQERSAMQAKSLAGLYGGDVSGTLASLQRIRDIQKYLNEAGAGDGIEVIPRARLAQTSFSQSHSES